MKAAQAPKDTKGASGPRREVFTTGLGVLAATLGSAVGLGNIWKFPSLTGLNGGSGFLLIYVISTLLIGLPVMIAEMSIGRRAKADAITAFRTQSPGKLWWLIGALGVLAAFFIMAFYTEVASWVLTYVGKAITGEIMTTNPETNSAIFGSLVSNPLVSLVMQWVVLAIMGVIIAFGVTKGIERVTKRLLPMLLILLVVVAIRSLTLSGAGEGLTFLFKPEFSKITWAVVLTAVGLAFFKLSIGMGAMLTYGSYYGDKQNIPATALRVMLGDLTISMIAGIAIFPAVFTYGFKPDAGASLLFITIPAVFASMPFGQFFAIIFFLLTFFAATGAMLSLVEVVVAALVGGLKWTRGKSTIVTVIGLALFGAPAALSNSTLANFTVFGKTAFDLYDYVSSNLMMPIGGFFICLYVGWAWGMPVIKEELSNHGSLNNANIIRLFTGVVKFVSPVLVLVVLLRGLGII